METTQTSETNQQAENDQISKSADSASLDNSANVDSTFVSADSALADSQPKPIYDATATQRFPFTLRENGELIPTAHIYKPIDDERHLQYITDFVAVRDGTRTDITLNQLTVDFWRDLIEAVENLETGEGEDFRDIPDPEEEIAPLLISYLAVVVKPPVVAENRKRSSAKSDRQTTVTQAYFNGEAVEQTHVLKPKSDEWRKKYNRIQRSQYKEDGTKGTRGETKVQFIPQNKAKAGLYDEMMIEAHGFARDIIPMRFKVVVVDDAFESSVVDAKK